MGPCTKTQRHNIFARTILQPKRKEGTDEGLEFAGDEVGEVTVAEVHADCHPNNDCL